ncbi:transcription factor [Pseudoxanthomonas kalamensis DSM 18571]|uniref:cupin-like domain-containing protein n=1 Tax=Pseudoxanthomonas kalamensis TaxID=289483 RepID=UPI001391DCE2|nr:cupin-like domain-containing protein [Pseudoxanthomonas kalamensis]KAF1709782.1 transcription factor [Pseudoxanthomonas kalamensis DSM 18571]
MTVVTPIEEFPADALPADLDTLLAGARPCVLRGLCADWPLVQLARQDDSRFAQALAGLDSGEPVDTLRLPPEAEGIVGYNDDLSGFSYRHFRVSVTEALQRLAACSRNAHPPGIALQSAPIATCLPGMLHTHSLPLRLPAATTPRIWIGNRVTTPAHFDSSHNIAVALCGQRRFTLFPPEQIGNLYIGPPDFAPTAAAITVARLDRPDFQRFPRLREALEAGQSAVLGPGDAIYIPPVWWHHVESLEQLNALVNYWWSTPVVAGEPAQPGLSALMHALLAFSGLPESERKAWQAVFGHYVFGEDPGTHLPPDRRGVLGPPSADSMQRLKELARRGL